MLGGPSESPKGDPPLTPLSGPLGLGLRRVSMSLRMSRLGVSTLLRINSVAYLFVSRPPVEFTTIMKSPPLCTLNSRACSLICRECTVLRVYGGFGRLGGGSAAASPPKPWTTSMNCISCMPLARINSVAYQLRRVSFCILV